jgi:hypothetical protein
LRIGRSAPRSKLPMASTTRSMGPGWS